ncbi:hypothetical protein ES332_D01G158000v1 [Gossypium tomentosum]|uniref:Uncharacterized protein n=1 Tax=Gossypium tomentosum TaxID=34277 RepID=A0A5D2M9J8_GOSTO|nr:hypothetical protein ES332_D01G158000v1 [Gossypium tomentosum]
MDPIFQNRRTPPPFFSARVLKPVSQITVRNTGRSNATVSSSYSDCDEEKEGPATRYGRTMASWGVRMSTWHGRGENRRWRVARMLRRLSLLPRVSDFPMFRLVWACNFLFGPVMGLFYCIWFCLVFLFI